jgi:hypothetical protein
LETCDVADVVINGSRFHVHVERSADGLRWTAQALREDGAAYGPRQEAWTEGAAVEQATRWLQWQADHTAALEALRAAEHAYHRARAGDAFAADGSEAARRSSERLAALDAARRHLDDVRLARPREA